MQTNLKIAILDGFVINPGDLSWDELAELGELKIYERTAPGDILARMEGCQAVFTNKCRLTAEIMDRCPQLKFIGVLATGYDNIDVAYAKARGIAVCNVPAYSSASVAQHTFALLLELCNHVALHNEAVQKGAWCRCPDYSLSLAPILQLSGRSLGIIGYGHIGRMVGRIAEGFGMEVRPYSLDPAAALASDVISLHCPATAENEGFVNREFLSRLKDGALLINTARGSLINEADLVWALKSGKLAGAALDVISAEPMAADSPLLGVPNLLITPHIAFASREARAIVCSTSAANLRSFLAGGILNRL